MFLPSTPVQTHCNNTFDIKCNHNEVKNHSNFFTIIGRTLLIKTMCWYSKNVGRTSGPSLISSCCRIQKMQKISFLQPFSYFGKKNKEWRSVTLTIDGQQASYAWSQVCKGEINSKHPSVFFSIFWCLFFFSCLLFVVLHLLNTLLNTFL
jgi:hypothetical protein